VHANVAAAGAMGKEVDWGRLFGDLQVDDAMARSVQAATAVECTALQAAGSTESVRMKVRAPAASVGRVDIMKATESSSGRSVGRVDI